MVELKAPVFGIYIPSEEELRLVENMRHKLALRLVERPHMVLKRVRMRRRRRGSKCALYHFIVRVVADVV